MNGLTFHPVLPWPWLALLTVLIVGAIGWSLRRGFRSGRRAAWIGAIRALALLALLLILAQPQRREDVVTTLRPQLAVLIDTSGSMRDPVDESQPRRAEMVSRLLDQPALEAARKEFDVRLFIFDQQVAEQTDSAQNLKFDGTVSNVRNAVMKVEDRFRGQPLAAILLVSDGLDTGGGAAVAMESPPENATEKTPLFAFELEQPFQAKAPPRRISLANVDYPPRAVIGWDTEVRVSLLGKGMSGQTVPVELWRDGQKASERAVAFNDDDQTRQIAFALSHEVASRVQYELRVPDPAADQDAESHPFVIEVMEPGNRVLYIQNTLGFDFKFLRRAIVTDENLQLSAFVRWADGRLVNIAGDDSQQSALDLSPKGLAANAVVILGDLHPDALQPDQAQALRDFVDHGGGLVLLGGPNLLGSAGLRENALGELMPVNVPAPYREGSFPIQITGTGLNHPVFGSLFAEVKDFPPLLTANIATEIAPTAEVLMQTVIDGKAYPVIVAMRFGQGRVICVLTDTIWRWRLAAKTWTAERSPYDTFWTQLMDWLIPKEQDGQSGDRLELFTERPAYILGERPEVRAILRLRAAGAQQPATLPLRIRTPDDKVFDYAMNPAMLQSRSGKEVAGFSAEVEPNVAGLFRAQAALVSGGEAIEGETRFVVNPPASELTGKPIDRDLLTALASERGGKFYPIGSWDDWQEDLRYNDQYFTRAEMLHLWNHPVLLGLILMLLATEWTTRKLWNLP